MIQQSIEHDDPIIFCEPKCRYWEKGEVDLETPPLGLFDAVVRREGTDVTLVGLRRLDEDGAARRRDRCGRRARQSK
jgi:pyruvate/2-oxoglutarate/acetoin dehydrogenase E1 component